MEKFVQKPNTGTLFKNDKGSEKAPGYKGTINVEGKEYEIAAWVKESKTGSKFFSLKIQEPYKADKQVEEKPTDFDDSIPF